MLRKLAVLCAVVAVTLESGITRLSAEETVRPAVAANEQDVQTPIASALEKKISLKLADVPLREFVDAVAKHLGHPCLLDRRALEDVGIGGDVPIRCEYREMSIRSVLNHSLRDLDLTWTVTNGALSITTPEEAEAQLQTRVIDVVDLVRAPGSWKEQEFDYDSLIDLITSTIAPTSWDTVGGPASIEAFHGNLVFSQTRDVHEQIEQFLGQFRKARKLAEEHVDSPPPVSAVGPAGGNPAVAKIHKALDASIVPEFKDVPLQNVAGDLGQLQGINVLIDVRALDDVGIGTDVPVSLHTGPIPLRDALYHILKQLDLTTVIRDEALVITTPEEAEYRLDVKAYPVGDLLGAANERDEFGDSRRAASLDQLIGLITSTIAPSTWDNFGGAGSIEVCPQIDVLAISQTGDVHEQIADLLGKIRHNLAQQERPAGEPEVADALPPTRLVVYFVPAVMHQQQPSGGEGGTRDNQQSQSALGNQSILSQFGGHMGGGGQGGGMGCMHAAPLVVVPESELLGAIVELIEPRSWEERDDVYAKVLPGRLLIRHTDAVHRQIDRLLQKLAVQPVVPAPAGMAGGGYF